MKFPLAWTCGGVFASTAIADLRRALGSSFLLALTVCASGVHAQEYPNRAIRMVAPFAAGGGGDVLTRTLSKKLADIFQQQVVVDNRAGALGIIGTESVAKAPADGYTIMTASSTHAINASTRRDLPYDSVKDFSPVSFVATTPFILVVHPSLPARSVPELLKLLRSRLGQIDYASSGATPYFAGAMLNVYAKVKMVNINYKGVAGAMTDVLAGAVPVTCQTPLTVMPNVRAGKLRALAVTTPKRSPAWPDLPTVKEGGVPDYDFTSWYGVLAPRDTPKHIVSRLNQAIAQAQQNPELISFLKAEGAEISVTSPEQFREILVRETARFTELVRQMGGAKME